MKVCSDSDSGRHVYDFLSYAREFLSCIIAIAMVICSNATEWNVYSNVVNGMTGVQQLTNAFFQAKSGDTITIHAGTYCMLDSSEIMDPYFTSALQTEYGDAGTCYFSSVSNITVQGDPSVTPDQVVLSGKGTSTSNYGKQRVMNLGGANCVVRNLTFTHGNCNYTRYINGVSQGWSYRRGGGLSLKNTSSVSNCIFTFCYSPQGAALCSGNAYDCVFDNSLGSQVALWTKVISGCTFRNCSVAIHGTDASGSISNCTFESCKGSSVISSSPVAITDCLFTNCTSVCITSGTNTVRGCVFAGNGNTAGSACCITNFTGKIVNCRFRGKYNFLEDCTDVEDCDFSPTGNWKGTSVLDVTPAKHCSFNRCVFHDFNTIQYGSIVINPVSMKNCLIRNNVVFGNTHAAIWYFTNTVEFAEIVNCTVVSNQSNCTLFNAANVNVVLKNVLFNITKTGGQDWGYCDFWATDLSNVYFTNCIVRAAGLGHVKQEILGNSANLLNTSYDPKFKQADAPDAPYSLKHNSPCVNAGTNELWMVQTTDLSGNPRLHEEVVDIGCYENCDPMLGSVLMFR